VSVVWSSNSVILSRIWLDIWIWTIQTNKNLDILRARAFVGVYNWETEGTTDHISRNSANIPKFDTKIRFFNVWCPLFVVFITYALYHQNSFYQLIFTTFPSLLFRVVVIYHILIFTCKISSSSWSSPPQLASSKKKESQLKRGREVTSTESLKIPTKTTKITQKRQSFKSSDRDIKRFQCFIR
jgi:hypothetical protein